jgi:hypothetical protein
LSLVLVLLRAGFCAGYSSCVVAVVIDHHHLVVVM